MPNIPNYWKSDLYPLVGKAFSFAMANALKNNKVYNLFGEVTTDSAYYELRGGGDFPELPDYDGSMNEINPARGFATIVAPKEKFGVYYIHAKQWKNDKYGELRKCASQLADACYVTISNKVLRKMASAFDATVIGGDGVAWAATNHPNGSKGTQAGSLLYEADASLGTYSNLFNEELSVNAIIKLQTAAARFETPSGNPYEAEYNLLVVPPELAGEAARICGTSAQLTPKQDPDSAENAANPVYGLRFIVCGKANADKKLGFVKNQWALVDATRFKETNKIVYNTKPESGRIVQPNPLKKGFYSYVDLDVGHGDSRSILFSQF